MEANVMCAAGACLNRRDYPGVYCADHAMDGDYPRDTSGIPMGGNGPGRQADHMGDVYGTPDRDIAIGEHAFRAGYAAGSSDADSAECLGTVEGVEAAWSAYDPPEELKGGGS